MPRGQQRDERLVHLACRQLRRLGNVAHPEPGVADRDERENHALQQRVLLLEWLAVRQARRTHRVAAAVLERHGIDDASGKLLAVSRVAARAARTSRFRFVATGMRCFPTLAARASALGAERDCEARGSVGGGRACDARALAACAARARACDAARPPAFMRARGRGASGLSASVTYVWSPVPPEVGGEVQVGAAFCVRLPAARCASWRQRLSSTGASGHSTQNAFILSP